MPNSITVTLNVRDILIWAFIGLIAGFLASRVMLGKGIGLLADIVVGILGAILANLLAAWLGFAIVVSGHPIISEIIMAFFGALILLLVLRLVGFGRRRRRAAL